jgi:hypothetical protein
MRPEYFKRKVTMEAVERLCGPVVRALDLKNVCPKLDRVGSSLGVAPFQEFKSLDTLTAQ